MNILYWILFGVIQGVFEWIPVSSEAILFIMSVYFGRTLEEAFAYAILMHLPTGLASLTIYGKEYVKTFKALKNIEFYNIPRFIILATLATGITAIPTLVIYDIFLKYAEETLRNTTAVISILIGITMIITALIMKKAYKSGLKTLNNIKDKHSISVGIFQGLSIIPGISRSGITIACLSYMGFDANSSINGSFMLAAPVSIAAFISILLFNPIESQTIGKCIPIAISMTITYLVSISTMKILIKTAKKLKHWMLLLIIGMLLTISGIIYVI